MECTVLSTDRLLLKGITPSTIHELFASRLPEAIMNFFGCDEAGYDHLKMMHERGMETYNLSLFFFLLINKESGTPLGDCGFHTWNSRHRKAELYYFLRKDEFKNKGYMTEALQVVIPYGFNEMKLHRIQAMVADYNTPSMKLLQRFGFTKEATLREDYLENGRMEDSDCYSLLHHEWASRNSSG